MLLYVFIKEDNPKIYTNDRQILLLVNLPFSGLLAVDYLASHNFLAQTTITLYKVFCMCDRRVQPGELQDRVLMPGRCSELSGQARWC